LRILCLLQVGEFETEHGVWGVDSQSAIKTQGDPRRMQLFFQKYLEGLAHSPRLARLVHSLQCSFARGAVDAHAAVLYCHAERLGALLVF
jgi:hypothetical protein